MAKERPVEVAWKLFSLAVVNAGNDYNTEGHAKGFRLQRTLLAARREAGNAGVERLYVALGDAIHGRREDPGDERMIRGCLTRASLSPELHAQALADPTTETDLLAEHQDAVDRLQAFGVPTIVLHGSDLAWYGPVVHPIPRGAEALALFDHTLWALRSPYLFELKRERKFKLEPQPAID